MRTFIKKSKNDQKPHTIGQKIFKSKYSKERYQNKHQNTLKIFIFNNQTKNNKLRLRLLISKKDFTLKTKLVKIKIPHNQ